MRVEPPLRARFAIIPCSKEKAWDADRPGGAAIGPQPARLAYRSPLFAAALAWAGAHAERVVIFSALHGLVEQDAEIPGAYDVTFSRPDDPVISSERVRAQAEALGLAADASLVCALPDDYAERLADALAVPPASLANLLRGVPLPDLDAMTAICLQAARGNSVRFAGTPAALG